jgi:hypothetical protein
MHRSNDVQEARERRSALQRSLRLFGLSGKPGDRALGLAAILIVVGAALLATSPHQGIATTGGATLWLLGAAIAIRGWLRIMRPRKRGSA